jgi:type VI secretion system secreted protein VgrG
MSEVQAGGQAGERLLSLQTVLGRDVLQPVSFHARESISAPFAVTVETVCDEAGIDPDQLLFQPACLTISHGKGESRMLQGMVRSLVATGQPVRDRFAYTLTFVPKLWFMGQTSDCRIFQNTTIADIVTTLCGEAGQTIELKIYGEKPQKVYVTQYNETDFAFLSRLLEEAGYYYYFIYSKSDHTMVVTDQNQGFPQDARPALIVRDQGGGLDTLTAWHKVGATVQGRYQLRDYDLTTPSTLPEAVQSTQLATEGASARDVFEWPALAVTSDAASARARLKMEAAEAEAGLFEATAENPALGAGSRFTISGDPYDESQGTEYIVRSVSSSGHDHSWVTGETGADFTSRFVAFKASLPWRERMVTPRPVMAGVHSAVVLGNSGEEIHADKYGRVKVRFFWDHRSDATADTTCWVRVMQPWSGNTWGWQHLPRVGTEVAVAFMDGDADRPLIMGGLYNGDMMPVFAVPDEQTRSGLRSRSTAQGSTSTFSELSFDDKKGEELMYLHAEKDMTVEVENDQKVTVTRDQTIEVDNNRSLTVKRKETIEVDDSQTVTVRNGRTTTVEAAGDSLTVKGGDLTVTTSQGDIAIEARAGSITIRAMQAIELSVGANKITINNEGVTVSATQIKVQGQAMVQVQAPMTQVSGDGMLTLKGGVMMLN